ncbi:MAG: EVE domain-containing protein [Nitrososphaerales archaeon]
MAQNEVNFWLCITNEKNWEVIKERNVWGVSIRHKSKMMMVKVEDLMVFYVKPLRLGGAFRVSSQPYEDFEEIFSSLGFPKNERFPYRVKLEPVLIPKSLVDLRPLIPKLQFTTPKEKRNWGGRLFGKTMISISPKDYEIMAHAIEHASQKIR